MNGWEIWSTSARNWYSTILKNGICTKENPSRRMRRTKFSWILAGLVSWHINLCRLSNANALLLEEQLWYYLTHCWEDKEVHAFPKSIGPKVFVIVWLEFEHAYYDATQGHPPLRFWETNRSPNPDQTTKPLDN